MHHTRQTLQENIVTPSTEATSQLSQLNNAHHGSRLKIMKALLPSRMVETRPGLLPQN
jgi:hypothetical protein